MKVIVWGLWHRYDTGAEIDTIDTIVKLYPTETARDEAAEQIENGMYETDNRVVEFGLFAKEVDYATPTLITEFERKPLIVEVDSFDGEDSGIDIRGAQRFRGEDGLLYCIGVRSNDGVIRFVDYGYRTPEEAKEAWDEAEYLPGRGL